jgi:hypothetical protein
MERQQQQQQDGPDKDAKDPKEPVKDPTLLADEVQHVLSTQLKISQQDAADRLATVRRQCAYVCVCVVVVMGGGGGSRMGPVSRVQQIDSARWGGG